MPGLRMDGYRCGLAAPEPIAGLIRACLRRLGLQVVALDAPDLDVALIDLDCAEEARPSSPEAIPVLRMAARPESVTCICAREDVCLCRLGTPFSPPFLVMRLRAALAAAGKRPVEAACAPAERVVLDLCSGSGFSTCAAADEHGPGTLVVGVDRSLEGTVEAAAMARLIGYAKVLFVVGDAGALPFRDGCFDEVCGADELAQWVRSPEALELAREEARRVLRG
jgi:hypothetical protein